MIREPRTAIFAAVAACALAAAAPAASAAAADAGPASVPRVEPLRVTVEGVSSAATGRPTASAASVKASGCKTSSVPASREWTLTAGASKVTGAKSVRVRFHLFVKPPGSAKEDEIRIETGTRLGYWESPVSVAAGGLKFVKRLSRLSSPATYRAEVDFEWYAGSNGTGKTVKATTVRSASCVQPDLRPDLRIQSLTVTPVGTTKAKVTVVVVNSGKGRSAAGYLRVFVPGAGAGTGPFNLALGRIDEQGTKRKPTKGDPLALSRTLTLEVARCQPPGALTVEIDPAGTIGERSQSDNFGQIGCLAAT